MPKRWAIREPTVEGVRRRRANPTQFALTPGIPSMNPQMALKIPGSVTSGLPQQVHVAETAEKFQSNATRNQSKHSAKHSQPQTTGS